MRDVVHQQYECETFTRMPEKGPANLETRELPLRYSEPKVHKIYWVAVKELKVSYHNGYI